MVHFKLAPSFAILALLIVFVGSTPLSDSTDIYERDISELQARGKPPKRWGKVGPRPKPASDDAVTKPGRSGELDTKAGRPPVSGRPGFDPYAGRMPAPRRKGWGKVGRVKPAEENHPPARGRPGFDPYAGRMPAPRRKEWGKVGRVKPAEESHPPVHGRPGFDPYAGRMPAPRRKGWGKARSSRPSGDEGGYRAERYPEEYSGRSGESHGWGHHVGDALSQIAQNQPWQQQQQPYHQQQQQPDQDWQQPNKRDLLEMEERDWIDYHDLDVRGYFDELD